MAVGRVDAARQVGKAGDLRDLQGHAAGQGELAVAVGQAAAGQLHGGQRGGAGDLDGQRRAAQVELVGDPGGDVVLVGRGGDPHVGEVGHAVRPAHQVAQQVAARTGSGEDPDLAFGAVAAAFEGFPAAFEEDPLLRVDQLGLALAVAEEGGVEVLDVGHLGAGPHELRVGQLLGRDPGGGHLLGAVEVDRLAAAGDQPPEILDGGRVREAAGHADDGDALPETAEAARPLGWRSGLGRRRPARWARAGSAGCSGLVLVGLQDRLRKWAARVRTVGYRRKSRIASWGHDGSSSTSRRGRQQRMAAEVEEVVVQADVTRLPAARSTRLESRRSRLSRRMGLAGAGAGSSGAAAGALVAAGRPSAEKPAVVAATAARVGRLRRRGKGR